MQIPHFLSCFESSQDPYGQDMQLVSPLTFKLQTLVVTGQVVMPLDVPLVPINGQLSDQNEV